MSNSFFNHAKNQTLRLRDRKKPIRILKSKPPSNIISKSPLVASSKDIQPPDEAVFIVAGGPSLKNFDFNLLCTKHTIAVNKSIFDIPNPNYFISVDYTFLRKVKKERNQFGAIDAKKFFVADLSHPDLVEYNGQIIDKKYNLVYYLQDYNRVIKAQRPRGIGYTFEDFCTGRNSGFCALQLAVVLGYKKIYLLGIDLDKQVTTHYHEGYGESKLSFDSKLDTYYEYFLIGLKQLMYEKPGIHVISCSKTSRLNDIIDYRLAEEVLNES